MDASGNLRVINISATPSISVSGINLNSGDINSGNNISANNFYGYLNGNISGSSTSCSGNAASSNYANSSGTLSGSPSIAGTIYCNGSDTIGVNYNAAANSPLIYSGTEYPYQANIAGFLYWGGGLNSSVVVKHISGTNHLISIKCAYGVLAQGLMCYSDRRIKRDFKNFNALEIIEKIEPKNYNYIETGNNSYGFIAQDIEINNPVLIQTSTNTIPNIFEIGEYTNDGIIKFENSKNIILKVNDIIKINDTDKYNKGNEFKIIEVIDIKTFKIDNDFEPRIKEGKVFLNGLKVDDFKSIDYNQITAINTKAIKEMFLMINDLQNRISILENNKI